MRWFKFLLDLLRVMPDFEPAASNSQPTSTDMSKVDFHIDRFERAVTQAAAPERIKQLKKSLVYWRAIKAAADLKPE